MPFKALKQGTCAILFPFETRCQLLGMVCDSFVLKAKTTELFTVCLGLVFSGTIVVEKGIKIKVCLRPVPLSARNSKFLCKGVCDLHLKKQMKSSCGDS